MADYMDNGEVDQNELNSDLGLSNLHFFSISPAFGNNAVQGLSNPEIVVESGGGTGNDGQLQGARINHQPVPEPEDIAIQGNNEPRPDEESTSLNLENFEFIVDDPVAEEMEVLNQLYEENLENTDTNNAEDQSLPRPPEANSYRLIPSEAPEVTKLHDLKCSEVRWFYKTTKGPLPFTDRDSLIIEIKYRHFMGLALDQEAQDIYKDHLAHLNLPTILSTDNLDNKKKVFVHRGYYHIHIDKDNKKVIAEYWTNDEKPILRRTYFTVNEKPLEETLATEIEKELCRRGSNESGQFSIGECQIVYHTTNEVTIQMPKQAPQNLMTYKKAELSQPTKFEHLIFVVHGVGHYENPNSIVESVKKLIDGVDSKKFFIPIHWRSSIEAHTCRRECSKEHLNIVINKILQDVRLYNCTKTGVKIRQSVIRIIKESYDQFKSNNQDFNGSVALFGHSLGSVICYDILTNFKNIQNTPDYELHFPVSRLFTVGSPLKIFLKKREALHETEGTSPIEQFCQIHEERPFKICNIYHPVDPVARRLDPLIDESYREDLAIKIRRGRGFQLRTYLRKQIRALMCMRVPPLDSGSPPQIDHEISGDTWQDPHSCYWYSKDVHQHIRRVAFNNVVRTRVEIRETTLAETRLIGVEMDAQVMSNNEPVPNRNNEVGSD